MHISLFTLEVPQKFLRTFVILRGESFLVPKFRYYLSSVGRWLTENVHCQISKSIKVELVKMKIKPNIYKKIKLGKKSENFNLKNA